MRSLPVNLASPVLCLLLQSGVTAQSQLPTPVLVKDIHKGPALRNPSSSPWGGRDCKRGNGGYGGKFVTAGGWIYFIAESQLVGKELYRTKGTSATTMLVADIWPGARDSAPDYLTALGSKLVFVATSDKRGRELFVTDPATNKTTIIDIHPARSSNPMCLLEHNGEIFFQAYDGLLGIELWRTDGTQAGTKPAWVFNKTSSQASSRPVPRLSHNKDLYVTADDGVSGVELWKFDGQKATRLADINPGSASSSPYAFLSWNGLVYFAATQDGQSGTGRELWATDGTPQGTKLVLDLVQGPTSSYPDYLASLGKKMYFTGRMGGKWDLYEFDGKTAKKIAINSSSRLGPRPLELVVVGTDLFFSATVDSSKQVPLGTELCRFDGSKVTIYDVDPGSNSSAPKHLAAAGNTLFFSAQTRAMGRELFKADASNGAQLVKDIAPGNMTAEPSFTTRLFGSSVLFAAFDGTHGVELWRSDGTTVGTTLVKDIDPGATQDSNPGLFLSVGDRAFFRATSDVVGTELFVTDGSASGTKPVFDLNPGTASSDPSNLVLAGKRLFFAANGTDPKTKKAMGRELWCLDLMTNALQAIDVLAGSKGSSPKYLAAHNGEVYFSADGNLNRSNKPRVGVELWRSDGTVAGTRLVTDLNPGTGNSSPLFMVPFKGEIYFAATDGRVGHELFKSDGTSQGTVLVADLYQGSGGSEPDHLTPLGDKLFFSANGDLNQSSSRTTGKELWLTDGTSNGTQAIDLWAGSSGSLLRTGRVEGVDTGVPFMTVGDRVLVVANGNLGSSNKGTQLWISDGTIKGTYPLNSGNRTVITGGTPYVTSVEDRIYFDGDDGVAGGDLMVSDGTPTGARPIRSVIAGSSQPRFMTPVGSRFVYYSAHLVGIGHELWRSDGTSKGTVLVADIWPGPPVNGSRNSNPAGFFVMNGSLFFAAADGEAGRELWRLDLDAYAQPAGVPCSLTHYPRLWATDPVLSGKMSVTASGVVQGNGILAVGARSWPLEVIGGDCSSAVALTQPFVPIPFKTSSTGRWSATFGVPNDKNLVGNNFALQAVYGPTSTAPLGLDFTNGVFLNVQGR